MRVLSGSPMATGTVALLLPLWRQRWLREHGADIDPAVVLLSDGPVRADLIHLHTLVPGRHPGGLSNDAGRPGRLSHGQEPEVTHAPMTTPEALARRLACRERAVVAEPRHG